MLVNLTNDAWFGLSIGPYQHFAQSRMRAVEEGVPLIRSAGTGISAVVDPVGRVVTQIALGRRGVVDSGVPVALPNPPLYARIGDGLLVVFVGIGAALIIRRRKTRNAGDAG
ncbi:hypothetical protein JCM17843_02000 [Kordiimonadales bacterium JCM 17843]|nr:hypothetical protein JCM17843_02000 [Kordiimonadales bacterium JCM 17843]